MIQLKSLKCPECNATLNMPEHSVDYVNCPYCGNRVFVDVDGEHIIRHVDEAQIRQTQADERIIFSEIMKEAQEVGRIEKRKLNNIKLVNLWLFLCVAGAFLFGLTMEGNRNLSIVFFAATFLGVVLGIPYLLIKIFKR